MSQYDEDFAAIEAGKQAAERIREQDFHTWVGADQRYFSLHTKDKSTRVATWEVPEVDGGHIGVQVIVYGTLNPEWRTFRYGPTDDQDVIDVLRMYLAMVEAVKASKPRDSQHDWKGDDG